MYSVIIAEDELFVRLGIKNSLPWESCGMQVVADVENGELAWEKLLRYHADILITDILMPVLDGKKLISRIQEAGLEPYIIVITCMEDFHLVRDLLNHGIRDYILKATITEEELARCLLKAKAWLDRHSHSSGHASAAPAFVSEEELQSRILQRCLPESSCPEDAADAADELAKHGIILEGGVNILALCPIEAVYDAEGLMTESVPQSIYRNLSDLIRQRSFTASACYSFLLEDRNFIIIMHYESEEGIAGESFRNQVLNAFQALHDNLQDYLNIRISFLLYPTEGGIAGIREAYKNAAAALERHYLNPMNSVSWGSREPSESEIETLLRPLSEQRGWIARCFGRQTEDQYLAQLAKLTKAVTESKEEMLYAMMACADLICGLFEGEMADEQKQFNKLLIRYPYLPEGITSLCSLLHSCEQRRLKQKKTRYRKEIEAALAIVERSFADQELSLSSVADRIGLSRTYFSTLFKQELEQPFIKYLTAYRVERSKLLLEQSDAKMFDIAVSCGFSDEAYFSRVFKKAAGISPSEWRSLWLQ